MKKIILLLLLLFFVTQNAFATNFTSAFLRLNNQSANSALSGTVCARASSSGAGTENKIIVTFPSDFTISATASNWTTNTTNLPVGSSAWPGIGATASNVNSKTVTFASSNLTDTNLYCFNFVGASSTTGSSGNGKTGTITSTNSSDTVIDSTVYATSIISSNQVNITASVDPQVSDLPIAIESTTPGTTFPQETTINYKITYGNSGSSPIPLTIQAEWTQGTISGNPSPSVDILNYVVGSASTGYGSTPAVINTVNRTITWTIASIPASTTNQTVTFSLKTTSAYTGPSLVSFDILARAISGATITPDESITQNYQYDTSAITPTPTPQVVVNGPGDGRSDGRTDGRVGYLLFRYIEIRSITKSDAKIAIEIINKGNLTINYGTSMNNLSKTVKTQEANLQHIINLSNLEADTNYYFKVYATDIFGNNATSDLFNFKTATLSPTTTIDLDSLIVTSNNNILLSPQIKNSNNLKNNLVVIPQESVFTIQFTLNEDIAMKSLQAVLRNKNVLGFSTLDKVTAASNYVNFVETSPGVYTGQLASTSQKGQYEVYIRMLDFNGNVSEQKILDLIVTNKFQTLIKGSSNTPIENVRLLLYLYSKTTKTYSVVSSQVLPIQNPSYSTPDGRYNLVLPLGKYKAKLSAIGYNPQEIEFEINQNSENYPIVYLEKNFSIINMIHYYLDVANDAIIDTQNYLKLRSYSNRLFDLIALSGICIFLLLTILSISARTHIKIAYFPLFLMYKLKILLNKHGGKIIFGKVVEKDTQIPLSRSVVTLINSKAGKTITLLTNKLGEFYYNNKSQDNFKIKIEKKGFESISGFDYKTSETKDFPISFELKSTGKIDRPIIQIIYIYLEDLLGMAMEGLILLGLLIQIYFIFTFGILKVAPFLIITVLNIILIFTYLYKPKALEK